MKNTNYKKIEKIGPPGGVQQKSKNAIFPIFRKKHRVFRS